ncbi:MAG: hypothetical protein MAG458_01479 [Nitrosopumilus sp.]|nr:hypothetical protein [Nitrosopumilus sp.]
MLLPLPEIPCTASCIGSAVSPPITLCIVNPGLSSCLNSFTNTNPEPVLIASSDSPVLPSPEYVEIIGSMLSRLTSALMYPMCLPS